MTRNLRAAFDYLEKNRDVDWKHVMSYAQAVVQSVVEQRSVLESEPQTAVQGLDPEEAAFITGMNIFKSAYREKLTGPLVERYEAQLRRVRDSWMERRREAVAQAKQDTRSKLKDRQTRAQLVDRIDRSAKRLYDWTFNPRRDKYVPEFMRSTVNDLLQSLDR